MKRFSLFNAKQARAIAAFLTFDAHLTFDAQHEGVANQWSEEMRVETLTKEGLSMEEIRALKEHADKEFDLPENYAQHALDMYWGQFLVKE